MAKTPTAKQAAARAKFIAAVKAGTFIHKGVPHVPVAVPVQQPATTPASPVAKPVTPAAAKGPAKKAAPKKG